MPLFDIERPTQQELMDIRKFFPDRCVFHWSGSGNVPTASLALFKKYRNEPAGETCKGCGVAECEARLAPNPNL